jgi:hypothetical protein
VDWQAIVATIIVVAAALWLARRVWRIVVTGSRDGEGQIGSCGTCSKNPEATPTKPLVQLGKNSK